MQYRIEGGSLPALIINLNPGETIISESGRAVVAYHSVLVFDVLVARSVVGRRRVANLLVAFQPRFWTGARTEWVEANGQVGVLILSGDAPLGLLSVRVSAEGIDQLHWQLNPTKIAAFRRSADRFS